MKKRDEKAPLCRQQQAPWSCWVHFYLFQTGKVVGKSISIWGGAQEVSSELSVEDYIYIKIYIRSTDKWMQSMSERA